jgi:sacsin
LSIITTNADQIQKFVLDTGTHPDSPVLIDGLSEYQGPALLAYNDATFSEKDFESLTSLGDSKKFQDKAATGKFGLGFSSVCV